MSQSVAFCDTICCILCHNLLHFVSQCCNMAYMKDNLIKFRIDEDLLAQLEKTAEAKGYTSPSLYVKSLVLGEDVSEPNRDPQDIIKENLEKLGFYDLWFDIVNSLGNDFLDTVANKQGVGPNPVKMSIYLTKVVGEESTQAPKNGVYSGWFFDGSDGEGMRIISQKGFVKYLERGDADFQRIEKLDLKEGDIIE